MTAPDLATQARFSAEMAGDLPIAGLLIQLADALDQEHAERAETRRVRNEWRSKCWQQQDRAALAEVERDRLQAALREKDEAFQDAAYEAEKAEAQVQAVRALADRLDGQYPVAAHDIRAALDGAQP